MSKKTKISPIATVVGAAFVSGMVSMPLANADENPFAMSELSSGYMVADKGKEGKCGEGKCGEAKCGGDMKKSAKEGKCGEGKCGGEMKKGAKEGKCGGKKAEEGKCGGQKAQEGKCGGKK